MGSLEGDACLICDLQPAAETGQAPPPGSELRTGNRDPGSVVPKESCQQSKQQSSCSLPGHPRDGAPGVVLSLFIPQVKQEVQSGRARQL